MAQTSTQTTDRAVLHTRVIDAPRALVYDAWTDEAHVSEWWGPNGYRTTTHEMDVRPGGVWRFVMHDPDGTDYPNFIRYREVARPARLVYDHSGAPEGTPPRFRATVNFDEQDGGTLVTLRVEFATAAELDEVKKFGAVEGGEQTLARFAAYAERRRA